MELTDLLSLDNALLIVLVLFMILWHRRTMARDAEFFEAQRQTMRMVARCLHELMGDRRVANKGHDDLESDE